MPKHLVQMFLAISLLTGALQAIADPATDSTIDSFVGKWKLNPPAAGSPMR